MADFIPNEGEAEMLQVLLGKIAKPALYMGLMRNTPTSVASEGEGIVWADILEVSGLVGGNAVELTAANWTVPTGASAGNPATHPQVEFTADTGGADNVSGYFIRSANNKLWVVGLNPEVELTNTLKTMLAGAKYRVNPQLGAS